MLRFIVSVLLLLGSVEYTSAQTPVPHTDVGLPFYLQHYPAHSYKAHPQNWSIAQDDNGIIYVGNFDGILEFDGSKWSLITTPSNTTVRSLSVGLGNTVFVGLQGDLGYLGSDSLGRREYNSLLARLPLDERNFWDVWSTHATREYVYFQTKHKIFRWDGKTFKIWTSENGYHTSFKIGNEVYVREKGVGLEKFVRDSLQVIPFGEQFSDKQIFALFEFAPGELLIATQDDGLYVHDGRSIREFSTEADSFLSSHRLYHGASLPGGNFALGMLDGGGLLILDKAGKVLQHFQEGDGLPDGWINYVFRDRQDGIWLALNNDGVVRLDPVRAITKFGPETGLEGAINDIERFEGRLYVGTSTGLFVLDPSSDKQRKFSRVEDMWTATSIVAAGTDLLVVGHGGLFRVDNTRVEQIVGGKFFTISASLTSPGTYYLGTKSGVSAISWNESGWSIKEEIVHVGEDVYGIVEDADGSIWISTRSGRIYSADLDAPQGSLVEYVLDSQSITGQIILARFYGKILMLGATGFYHLDKSKGNHKLSFSKYDTKLSSDTLLAVGPGFDESFWKLYSDRVEIDLPCNHECDTLIPESLKYPDWKRPAHIHVDSSGVAWISSGSMLVRYDPSVPATKSYEAKFPALLRRVVAIDSNRLLFGGALNEASTTNVIPDLPFQSNALRFEFALPSYNDVSGNEFQYWLEGKDHGWSDWTRETSKNYTNLLEGTYEFHIRGRNAQGYVSDESVYTFRVLPPWYRSTWAYGAYFLVLIGIGLFARRHHRMVLENKRAKKQALELAREREINERLHDLNIRLHQANETLRQADRLKDEFLANTSHELRTPLTGILGCSAILRDEVPEDQREFVDMIDENGQRLLNTLDSLLDLARLRAGIMELDLKPIDVADRAKKIMRSYYPLASNKNVALQVTTEGEACGLFDDHCLECILNHLIGNAVKFTQEGQVNVNVIGRPDHLVIEVEDTGVGIDAEFMPFLFDEFKQESTGLTRSHEGNGLGMAVTSRIVTLMGGTIDVTSTKGVGTTFTVRLPLDRDEHVLTHNGAEQVLEEAHVGSAS